MHMRPNTQRTRVLRAVGLAVLALLLLVSAMAGTNAAATPAAALPWPAIPWANPHDPDQPIQWYPGIEWDVALDLSEGRGDHVQTSLLPGPLHVRLLGGEGEVGPTKQVQALVPGDRVLLAGGKVGLVTSAKQTAYQENPVGRSRVVATTNRLVWELLELRTSGDTIRTTPEHPFRVGKAWVPAGQLKSGTVLETSSKKPVTVVSSKRLKLEKPERVYNLETEPNHNYFVGKEGLLVHNGGCISPPASTTFEFAEGAAQGAQFKSYNAFTDAMGSAGPGHQWHHIVEQNATNMGRFGPGPIQNTGNMLKLDIATHQRISGYYSSIDPAVAPGMRVRDWVSAQPYSTQYQFGLDQLRLHGVVP